MFNNHKMIIINNLNVLGNSIMDINHVAVAAITSEYPNYDNVYNAGILTPPVQILMRWADGDPYIMQTEYPRYLSLDTNADEFIVGLLAALTKRDIVLYIPTDEYMIFGQFLLNHLYYMYGVVVENTTIPGMQPTQFYIMPEKIPFIISKLYMYDLMESNVFLELYPANYNLPDFVINKLAMELKPLDNRATFVDYANYFNNIVRSKMNIGVNMVEVNK